LAWGLGSPERGVETLAKMNAADLATDWGIRMLSDRSPLFEPLNYNYGAVWPFLTGWVSTALFQYGFVPQGFQALMGNARHTFDNALGSVTELYSGTLNTWPQEGVPHQGFSTTGVILPLVRGLLGLDGDANKKEIFFEPALPVDWPHLAVSNWRIGAETFSLDLDRQETKIVLHVRSEAPAGFRMIFAPALGLGTKVLGAMLNGSPMPFLVDTAASAQAVRPRVEITLKSDDTLELAIDPAPEIVPPDTAAHTGDPSRGLKILRTRQDGPGLVLIVEGLPGRSYVLQVKNVGRIDSVTGAKFDGQTLTIDFPDGTPGEFVRRDIAIRFKV
jgi:hypothetical protein